MTKPALATVAGSLLVLAGGCALIIQGTALHWLVGRPAPPPGAADYLGWALVLAGLPMMAIPLARAGGRRWRPALAMLVYCALFIGCLVMLYLIAGNHPVNFDVTRRQYHSLQAPTLDYLRHLRIPVEMTAFHVPGVSIDKRRMTDVLRRYADASSVIEVNAFNPITQPLRAAEYAPDVKGGDIFIRRIDAPTTGAAITARVDSLDEETLTNAIVRVVRGREVTIHFMQGHGERSVETGGDPRLCVTGLWQFWKSRGFAVETINLSRDIESRRLDADRSILVCAGPETDITAPERELIERYLAEGGKAVFLLDPVFRMDGETPEIRRMLDRYGIEIRRDIVIDSQLSHAAETRWGVLITDFGHHAIGANMPRINLPMDRARTVRRTGIPRADVVAEELLFADPKASIAENLDLLLEAIARKDRNYRPASRDFAAHPLAVAAEARVRSTGGGEERTTRLVVFGDSDLFSDLYWDIGPQTLMTNVTNWLEATSDRIPIPARRVAMPPLVLTGAQRRALEVTLVLAMPFLILFGGVAYSLVRRRLG